MFRLSGVLAIFLAAVCGTLLFWTSQSVQRAEKNLSQTTTALQNEEESLRVLSAEWDYLNRPERLENLARDAFDLEQGVAKNPAVIDSVQAIPEPVIPIIPKMKPLYISTKKNKEARPLAQTETQAIIQNSDQDSFEVLIDDVAKRGRE